MLPCRCRSLKRKVLGGQRGSDGHDQQPVQADGNMMRRGSQGGGVGVPVFTHRHRPSWSSSYQLALHTNLSITFSGDRGPMGPPGPKGMLLLLLLGHHQSLPDSWEPKYDSGPSAQEHTWLWLLDPGPGRMCLPDRETEAQQGVTKHHHHGAVIGWPLGW